MPPLQLTADDHLSRRIDAVNLKHCLGDVETDCRDRFHAPLPKTATATAAITSLALTCRLGSRPQHQKQTSSYALSSPPLEGLDSPPWGQQASRDWRRCKIPA